MTDEDTRREAQEFRDQRKGGALAWAEKILGPDPKRHPALGDTHRTMILDASDGSLSYTQVQVIKAILKEKRLENWKDPEIAWGQLGDDGLPKHLPFPVTAGGNGPADRKVDAVRLSCWCGSGGCHLDSAMREAVGVFLDQPGLKVMMAQHMAGEHHAANDEEKNHAAVALNKLKEINSEPDPE